MKLERILKIVLLGLALFDALLGTIFIFFGEYLFSVLDLASYAQPRFFMICVGLFLYLYVYIQFTASKGPRKYSTCLNMSVLIRFFFPFMYIAGIFLWGRPFTLLHTLFAASAFGDLVIFAFFLYAMKKLKISFFQGDETPVDTDDKGPSLLRMILLILAIAEFLISLNWIFIPKFWLQIFDVTYIVDPFWTRTTGLFLLNIAYIQFLGSLNVYKYRTAVITSGLFRALWPILYWYWTAFGEGNLWFKIFIMFFSFFDTAMCITIFSLLKKAMRQGQSDVRKNHRKT
jgi:hypothetical protein